MAVNLSRGMTPFTPSAVITRYLTKLFNNDNPLKTLRIALVGDPATVMPRYGPQCLSRLASLPRATRLEFLGFSGPLEEEVRRMAHRYYG